MRFESPDAEPASAPQRYAVGPIVFSVVLHGVVLGLFARSAFAPEAEAKSDARPYVRIALAVRQPPPPPENLPQPENLLQEVEQVPEPEVAEEPEEATTPAGAEPVVADSAPTADPDDEEDVSDTGPAARTWTPASIRAAIETGSSRRRSTLTEAWVTECILEQKERGTRDCEQHQEEGDLFTESTRAGRTALGGAFTDATRAQRHAGLVDHFLRQNAVLGGLMEEGGEVGTVAAELYYMNHETIAYLTGNRQSPVFAAMGNFSADVLGGPQLSLPGNILFSCKKKPCIYEYTGFEVEQPDVEPEEGEFRVVPTLFGPRR